MQLAKERELENEASLSSECCNEKDRSMTNFNILTDPIPVENTGNSKSTVTSNAIKNDQDHDSRILDTKTKVIDEMNKPALNNLEKITIINNNDSRLVHQKKWDCNSNVVVESSEGGSTVVSQRKALSAVIDTTSSAFNQLDTTEPKVWSSNIDNESKFSNLEEIVSDGNGCVVSKVRKKVFILICIIAYLFFVILNGRLGMS